MNSTTGEDWSSSRLDGETRIQWLVSRNQPTSNSATELGREVLAGVRYDVRRFGRQPMSMVYHVLSSRKLRELPIYYQFGTPAENLAVAILIRAGIPVVAHYLDRIADGYPPWARHARLHLPIEAILRNAALVLAISPIMRDHLKRHLRRSKPTLVNFKTIPDGPLATDTALQRKPDAVIFAGNVNRKTNLSSLLDAKRVLDQEGLGLVVHTRTNDETVLRVLRSADVFIAPTLDASDVIKTSARYLAQLLPFNTDSESQRFYTSSTPSKIPNLLMARRPILCVGPSDFWVYRWLRGYDAIYREPAQLSQLRHEDHSAICGAISIAAYEEFRSMSDNVSWSNL